MAKQARESVKYAMHKLTPQLFPEVPSHEAPQEATRKVLPDFKMQTVALATMHVVLKDGVETPCDRDLHALTTVRCESDTPEVSWTPPPDCPPLGWKTVQKTNPRQ